MKKSYKKIYITNNNDNDTNIDNKYYEDYNNSYDSILLSNLCIDNEIKEDKNKEKENDDIEFNHWFLMKSIPYNILALSFNILFLCIVGSIITLNLKIEGNAIVYLTAMMGFEVGQWLTS